MAETISEVSGQAKVTGEVVAIGGLMERVATAVHNTTVQILDGSIAQSKETCETGDCQLGRVNERNRRDGTFSGVEIVCPLGAAGCAEIVEQTARGASESISTMAEDVIDTAVLHAPVEPHNAG